MAAIFGVILLHVSAPFLIPFENTRQWWIGNVYDSFSRWCVPLFVMVSGALILPKAGHAALRYFLLVRVRRILIPFLVWSAIYFLYRFHIKGDDLTLLDFFRMLFTEPIYYHLWFIYMLIVLYLLAPVAGAFLDKAPDKHVLYLFTIWFIWSIILPLIEKPLDIGIYYTSDMDDYSALRLSGYFLLGYMLRNRRVRSWLRISILVLLFMASGAVTVFGTYFMSRGRGEFHPYFYRYFSPGVFAMTASLFLFIKSILTASRNDESPGGGAEVRSPRWAQATGMSIFGVYLVHALVLELLRDGRFGFIIDHDSAFGMELGTAAGVPVFSLCVFLFSLVPVLAIRAIPVLRDVVA